MLSQNDFLCLPILLKYHFYNIKKEDFDDDLPNEVEPKEDPLMSNINNILKEKRAREKIPFNVNNNNKKEIKERPSKVIKKK